MNFAVDDCNTDCPVARTARIIESKWTTLIIRELLSGKKRYSELQRALTGISPKVLSERLKLLTREQLVVKTIYATVPPTTEYELTPLGYQFQEIIEGMARFGARLLNEVDTQVEV